MKIHDPIANDIWIYYAVWSKLNLTDVIGVEYCAYW